MENELYIPIPDKIFFDSDKKSFYDITPFGAVPVHDVNVELFYQELAKKYLDTRKPIFFYEMIEEMCREKIIDPRFFVTCYKHNFLKNFTKYKDHIEDMYKISSNIINKPLQKEDLINKKLELNKSKEFQKSKLLEQTDDIIRRFELSRQQISY
jgi:hypothetical protein